MIADYIQGQKITIVGSIIIIFGSFMPWITIWIFSMSIFDIVSLKYGALGQEFGPYIAYFLFFLFTGLLLLISTNLLPVSDPPRYSGIMLALSFIFWTIIFVATILGIAGIAAQSPETCSIPISMGSGELVTFLGIIFSYLGVRKWKEDELKEESEKEMETIDYLHQISGKD